MAIGGVRDITVAMGLAVRFTNLTVYADFVVRRTYTNNKRLINVLFGLAHGVISWEVRVFHLLQRVSVTIELTAGARIGLGYTPLLSGVVDSSIADALK